jgi:hypothetical protein
METIGPVLVKFSPPRGTPFGERWSDLLMAEAQSSATLELFGYPSARSRIVQTPGRTYLVSERFDRAGMAGRRHVVSVGVAHAGWVKGSYNSWTSTCDALHRQGCLPQQDALALTDIAQFGRLIGNTDMHSGNASLFALGSSLAEIARGQFALAPVYDMLPMRWRPVPDPGLPDYAPFPVSEIVATTTARDAAHHFWTALAEQPLLSDGLRGTAKCMADALSKGPKPE